MSGATTTPMSRRELEEKIVARAWSDDAFRARFVADPKGQFEAHLGTKLPDSLTMTVHEEDQNSIHFVIPAKPKIKMDELSDDDLEKIAGGIDVVVTVAATALVFSATLGAGIAAAATVEDVGWGS